MASVEKTIKIIFDADDKTARAVGSVNRGLGSINTSVNDLTAPLASAFDIIAKLNLAFIGLSSAVVFFSVGAAGKAEDALIELNKVMDDGIDATDNQKQQIKDLAREYAEFGSVTTLSVAEFKRSGFDFRESLGLTETALKAKNATDLDAVAATEALKSALSGMSLNFEDSNKTIAAGARIMEVWNNASNEENTTVGKLAEAFKQLSPLIDIAGLSLEETTSLAAVVISVFGEGAESARGLKTAFLRLADPTADISKALKTLGVDSKDAEGSQRSIRDILYDVADAWQDVDDSQKAGLASQIAGKDQAAKFAIVMNDFNRVIALNSKLKEDSATLDEELAKRMQALTFKLDSLKASYAAVGVSIGEAFLDGSKDQIDALTNLAQSFDTVVTKGGLKPLFDLLDPLMEGFSDTINDIATNLPAAFEGINFDKLINSFKLFGSEIESVFTAIAGGRVDLSTEKGLTKFLQGLTDAGADFVEISAKMFGSFESIARQVGDFIESLSDMDDGTAGAIGNLIGLGKQLNVLTSVLPNIRDLFLAVAGALATAKLLGYATGVGTIGTAVGGLVKLLGVGGLVTAAGAAGYAIGGIIRDNEDLFPWINKIGVFLGELAAQTVIDFNRMFPDDDMARIEQRVEGINTLLASLGDTGHDLSSDDVAEYVDNVLSEFEGLTSASAEVINNFGQMSDNSAAVFTDMSRDATSFGSEYTEMVAGMPDLSGPLDTSGAVAAMVAANSELSTIVQNTDDAGNKGQEFVKTFEKIDGAIVPVFTAVGTSIKKAGDDTDEARKKADAYHLKLLELASDERIQIRKIEVEFDIAKLQEGTKQVQSAFESINTGIQSTGEVISSLFDTFKGANLFEKSEIRDQISKENKFREQEFKEQKRVNDAVIDNYRAQATRFMDGIQIHVDAGTITPNLQAILRTMLVDSKIFMNENGAEALLSCQG